MRRLVPSIASLAAAVALSSLLMAHFGSGRTDAITTAELVAPVGLAWLLAAHLAARSRRLGPLRAQYGAAMLGTVLIALVATLLVAQRMFVSHHDALVLIAVMAFAAVVGARTAVILATRAAADVASVQRGLAAIAGGDLTTRVEPSGATEVVALARSANATAEALQRAQTEREAGDLARRNLVAAVSHDLRTPLTSIRLLVDAVGDGVVDDPAELKEALGRVGVYATTLSSLVDDLFELARLDAGDHSWPLSPITVPDLLDDAVEAFEPQTLVKSLHLRRAVDGPLPIVVGSPERLSRVLNNLLSNAIRHTPPDGRIELCGRRDGNDVVIEVADDGEGIADDELPLVFDRFWRGGEAARSDGRAGLGLPICRAIVEAHGGRIWAERRQPHGTSIRFTLPARG